MRASSHLMRFAIPVLLSLMLIASISASADSFTPQSVLIGGQQEWLSGTYQAGLLGVSSYTFSLTGTDFSATCKSLLLCNVVVSGFNGVGQLNNFTGLIAGAYNPLNSNWNFTVTSWTTNAAVPDGFSFLQFLLLSTIIAISFKRLGLLIPSTRT